MSKISKVGFSTITLGDIGSPMRFFRTEYLTCTPARTIGSRARNLGEILHFSDVMSVGLPRCTMK